MPLGLGAMQKVRHSDNRDFDTPSPHVTLRHLLARPPSPHATHQRVTILDGEKYEFYTQTM